MIFKAINKITLQEYDFEVEDLGDSSLYYHFKTHFQGLDEGEYRIELYSDGEIVSTGLMTIGNYKSETIENNEDKEYIQYEG